jgi:flagellar basal-body rod protein FlgF
MENTGLIMLSRQGTLMRQMAVVANNIANMNTNGFKGEKMMFAEYIVKSQSRDQIGREKVSFVRDIASARDFSEGPMQNTGNPLDIAIRGDGFLAVGSNDGELYTRNGHLRLNETGQLVTQAGNPVLSSGGQPFFFAPEDKGITITRDGTVSTNNGELGKLKVVKFNNEQKLRQVGGGMFTTSEQPQNVKRPEVLQGMLEQSNVQPIIEMAKMIEVQRAYAAAGSFISREDKRQLAMIRDVAAPI